MKRDVRILPAADADIDEHFYYLQERSDLEMAFRFIDALKEAFARLLDLPEMGSLTAFDSPRLSGVRMWRVKGFDKHLIFYRPSASGIEIMRVLHSSRDIKALFEEEA